MIPLIGAGYSGRAKSHLLLHMDGADASTTFTDSSDGAHAVTPSGNAQIDTAQSVFGGASGLFDGTGDFLTVADHVDHELGAGDFTIDFRIRFASVVGAQVALGKWNTAANQRSYMLHFVNNPIDTFRFVYSVDGTVTVTVDRAWSPSVDTWYHFALVRSGATARAFVDGTQIGADIDMTGVTLFDGTSDLVIGDRTTPGIPLNGWLDEVRIVKDVAHWAANFTPSTVAYP